jgi:hypothetical protein
MMIHCLRTVHSQRDLLSLFISLQKFDISITIQIAEFFEHLLLPALHDLSISPQTNGLNLSSCLYYSSHHVADVPRLGDQCK